MGNPFLDFILKNGAKFLEKEGVQAGEKALARSAADRAAIEASEIAGEQAVKDLPLAMKRERISAENYDNIARPEIMSEVEKINAAENAGFSNTPRVVVPERPPVTSTDILPGYSKAIKERQLKDLFSKAPDGPRNAQSSADVFHEAGLMDDIPLPPAKQSQYATPIQEFPSRYSNAQLHKPIPEPLPVPEAPKGPQAVKEELNPFGKHLDNIDPNLPVGPSGQLGGAMSNKAMGATAAGGAGILALLGLTGAGNQPPVPLRDGASLPSPGKPAGMADSLEARSGDVLKPDVELDPESPANAKAVAGAGSAPSAGAKAPVSDAQALADMLQHKDEAGPSLKDIMEQKNFSVLANQLGKAGEIIGSSLSRTAPVAQKAFDDNIATAEGKVKDFKELQANAVNDPNSAVSKNYREFLKRYGVNAGDGVSAAQIKEVLMPAAQKDQDRKERLDARKEEVMLKNKAIDATKDQTAAYREANLLHRQKADAGRKLIQIERQLAQGGDQAMRQLRTRISGADAIFGTAGIDPRIKEAGLDGYITRDITEKDIDQIPNEALNKLPRQFIAELAVETNRMLTASGVPAQSTFKKLMPNNVNMDAAGITSYVTNKLEPAKQAEYIKSVMKVAARVKRNSQVGLAEHYKKTLSGLANVRDILPEDFDAKVRAYGLDPADFGGESTAPKLSSAEKKQILDFSKQHGWSYEKAEKLYLNRRDGGN